jgi:hypothetical protein
MKNHKSIVAKQLEQSLTGKKYAYFMPGRRAFIAVGSISLLGAVTSYSINVGTPELEAVIFTKEFQFLFDVAFPATLLQLDDLRQPAIERLIHLNYEDAASVINLFNHFAFELQKGTSMKDGEMTIHEGEEYLARTIKNHPDIANQGLDVIYSEISNVKNFRETLWDRKISLYDKKCAYWENYDVKPSS